MWLMANTQDITSRNMSNFYFNMWTSIEGYKAIKGLATSFKN